MNKRDFTREQIIKAALRVFGEHSFQNASISKIAREAKVAEGTIYQHFKNKEDLFFYIPIERTNAFCDGLDLHLRGIHDTASRITKFVWYFLHFFKNNPDYARMIMLEMRVSSGFLKSRAWESLKRYTDLVLDTIKAGQEDGTFRKDISAFRLRQLLFGILEHVVVRWLIKDEAAADPSEDYEQIADLVLHGIGSSASVQKPYVNVGRTRTRINPSPEVPAPPRKGKSLGRGGHRSGNDKTS